MASQPNPYSFTYTDEGKKRIEETGGMLVTGFGLDVTKITFK